MITCPSCGSETADGVTCVVCGAEPADAGEHHEPSHDQVDAGERELVGAAAADASTGASAGPTATAPPGPPGAHHGAVPSGPGGAAPPPPTSGTQVAWPATPPPHPDAVVISENSRNWGMIVHLSALVAAGLGGLGFLGPLVVWLVRKDQDRYVAHHAVEALNFNLSIMLYAILAVLLAFTIVLIPVSILMAVLGAPFWFIASIVAAVKAQRGEGFRYPLTIRLVKE